MGEYYARLYCPGRAGPAIGTPIQLAEDRIFVFIHFTVNTFTDQEWGSGTESPAIFNPSELDARQWVQACKSAGMSGLILTCKHHDGFCLWPSAYTGHSVKNSPWRDGLGDVVKETAEACQEAGLKFGVYLSPWDRHEKTYGDSHVYNTYFLNQLIRELKPGAVISICGPDVRWCGNEAGHTRESEWCVVPSYLLDTEEITAKSQQEDNRAFARQVDTTDEDLGSRAAIKNATKR